MCLQQLADTHLKLHAFTLAEYCYIKIKAINLKYLQSLVEQNKTAKSTEALTAIPTVENEATLSDEEKIELTVILIKYIIWWKFS